MLSDEIRKMRVFWGVALSPNVRESLLAVSRKLEQLLIHQSIKWLTPDNYHLTVRFVGEVTPNWIDQCCSYLQEQLKDESTFEIIINTVQLFPQKRPHVIASMVKLDEKLARIYHIIEKACQACGSLPEMRPYVPHITLARIKKMQPNLSFSLPNDFSSIQCVDEITLFKSEQYNGSRHYSKLFSIVLNK